MADVYNTTVNVNGKRLFSSSYSLGNCGCCRGMYSMNSCFGFGFGNFGNGLGMGLGYGLGMALVPAMPAIISGLGKGLAWFGSKVIAPAASGVWKGITSAVSWVGKGIAKGIKAIGSIFKKKSKTEKA